MHPFTTGFHFSCPRSPPPQPPGQASSSPRWRTLPSHRAWGEHFCSLRPRRSKICSIHHGLPLTHHICLPWLCQAGAICLPDTFAAAGSGGGWRWCIYFLSEHRALGKGFANLLLESSIFLPSRASLCALDQEQLPRCDLGFLLLSVLYD